MAARPHDAPHTTSTGIASSTTDWLDDHFELARPEYEAQLRAVGIRPGWRVLDAGCGGGSFLPWIAESVGPSGNIAALDLTPENVAVTEQRVAGWSLPCPVEARVGDVTALPYRDGHFDAVWFANTSQYLDDDELLAALAEFRRVVRPGGLVAVKDSTGPIPLQPLPPLLQLRLWEAVGRTDESFGGIVRIGAGRNPFLRRWLERAGLKDVWQRPTAIERWAPFTPQEQRMTHEAMGFLAMMAGRVDVSAEDRETWGRISDPESPANPANHPEGYAHEGNILAVGRVP
jgi:ubiquinone/menaquinone biosynthesis C-methylase UbiE